jgi:hypothetical protein
MPTKAAVEDWTTPGEVLEPVHEIFGGHIDFDPCGNPASQVGAKKQVWLPKWTGYRPATEDQSDECAAPPEGVVFGDGLDLGVPWSGSTFINPPYDAKTLGAFMARARREAERGVPSIMLTKIKLVKGWNEHVPAAPAVCFLGQRLVFGGGGGESAPFDCALILWTRSRELVHRFALELDGRFGDVMFHR